MLLALLCTLARAENTFIVSAVLPMTGASAAFGTAVAEGATLALEQYPRVGSLATKLIVHDDGGRADAVPAAAAEALADAPAAVLGEVASARTITLAGFTHAAGVPLLTPSATNPAVTGVGDDVFRACFVDSVQGEAMARYAYKRLHVRSVGVLTDSTNGYSGSLAETFRHTFTQLGGRVLAVATYEYGDLDFKAQLAALRVEEPEALYLPGYYTEVALIQRSARERGYRGIFLGGDGWDSERLTAIARDASLGSFFTGHYARDDTRPGPRAFERRFEKRFHHPGDSLSALGYDAMMMLLAAAETLPAATLSALGNEAAAADRTLAQRALRDAIARIRGFRGATGSITMGASRDPVKQPVILTPTADGFRFAGIAPK